ncbi:hypothetical protein BS50DRAFT_135033 [Corynespora cassiicola Philippines]|uniref:Uncharacterized protein n=1 Tax=Corynespora cassiicola Philippines TaxID=1448308 RepID=A0A2T2NAC9_CORCC|nr:hypothetical protein BS50DRAFT_135033 [Corynespora cassiicola Philippines]
MHRDPSHHTIWRTVADPPSQATLASLHQQSVSASSGAQCHPSDGAATAGLQTQDIIRWRCCRRPSYWPTVAVQLAPSRPMAEGTCPDGYLRSAGRPSSRFRTVAWMGGWEDGRMGISSCEASRLPTWHSSQLLGTRPWPGSWTNAFALPAYKACLCSL